MNRSSRTSDGYTTALLLGSLVALVPTFVCLSCIAITGFISNPWPAIARFTIAASLLGALTGGVVYWVHASFPLTVFSAVLTPLVGVLFGPLLSRLVQAFLAQWNTVHIYDESGVALLIVPPGWSWVYTAITWMSSLVCWGLSSGVIIGSYGLWKR